MPKTFEIRRHAERSDRSDEGSGLSADGRAMAEALSRSAPRYELVVATPVARARQTARLIAGRLDEIVPALLPDLGSVMARGEYVALGEMPHWVAFVRGDAVARQVADEQLDVWASLIAKVSADGTVLAASHGGAIELPAAQLAARLGAVFAGPSFGYCEGVRVTYEGDGPVGLEVIRV